MGIGNGGMWAQTSPFATRRPTTPPGTGPARTWRLYALKASSTMATTSIVAATLICAPTKSSPICPSAFRNRAARGCRTISAGAIASRTAAPPTLPRLSTSGTTSRPEAAQAYYWPTTPWRQPVRRMPHPRGTPSSLASCTALSSRVQVSYAFPRRRYTSRVDNALP